jgi:hypothetical protein
VLVDGTDEAIVKQAFPEGSTSYLFPHYKVDMVEGDRNIAVAMSRVGIEKRTIEGETSAKKKPESDEAAPVIEAEERAKETARAAVQKVSASLSRDRLTGRQWLTFAARPPQDVIAALKASGWRWSGFRKAWHHASKFAKAPETVAVRDEGEVSYAEERAERLEERAGKKIKEAESARARGEAISSMIPLGQPILVGHHSERRHRRDIERIHGAIGKEMEARATAAHLEEAAARSRALQEQKVSDPEMIERRLKTNRAQHAKLSEWARTGNEEAARQAEIVRREIERDEKLLSEAGPLPEKTVDVAKRLKAILKKDHPSVRVRAGTGRAGYVEAWIPSGEAFSADLRNAALDAVYGPEFARNRENPAAGNVSSRRIALQRDQWKKALLSLGIDL